MKKRHPFPLLALALVLAVSSAADPTVEIAPYLELVHLKGNVVINGAPVPYELKVTYESFAEHADGPDRYWGSDEMPSWRPRWVISGILLHFNGIDIAIPACAFRDLGNPLGPSFPEFDGTKSETILLVIPGSDGAGSYQSTLRFREGRLVERVTQDHESLMRGDDYNREIRTFN